jgi:hypothetical protein
LTGLLASLGRGASGKVHVTSVQKGKLLLEFRAGTFMKTWLEESGNVRMELIRSIRGTLVNYGELDPGVKGREW